MSDEDVCWICFGSNTQNNNLEQLCKCDRKVHRPCLARWQLQSSLTSEEKFCRFCHTTLPDWVDTIHSRIAFSEEQVRYLRLSIEHRGKSYYVRVPYHPSLPNNSVEFESIIKRTLGMEDTPNVDVAFYCTNPIEKGDVIKLTGLDHYSNVIQMAACNAFLRQRGRRQEHRYNADMNPSPRPVAIDNVSRMPEEESKRHAFLHCFGCFRA